MKRFSVIAASFVFAAIFAVSAFGQAAQPAAARVVVINPAAFDGKDGITKYASAVNIFEAELKPLQTEIDGLATRHQNLGKEIQIMQANAAKSPAVPIDQKAAQAKVEEYQNLELTIKRKQEDGNRKAEASRDRIMGPVMQEIGKAMDDFAKAKGYALILDASKLGQAILAWDPAKIDVTKEFITFFNARGGAATAATTTKP
jgi:Skp family chaperone for outer membrane proteins